MTEIHPTAVVESGAVLGQGVQIGPHCVVGSHVRLGDGVRLVSHVVVAGHTTIGAHSTIYPFASLGHPPQHVNYKGEDTELVIGAHNVIRESVTMNPGTAAGGGVTRVGHHGYFLTGSHVAHDCFVGDHVTFINGAVIGGHVHVEDHVTIGGLAAVHQRSRIGRHAFIGGMSGVEGDVIPYGSVLGNRAYLGGLNIVGIKRRGFSRDTIHTLRNAYRLLFAQEGTFQERLADVEELFKDSKEVMEIVAFVRAESSSRSLVMPNRDG
jgi:UDP-N-acetylglucosamine acyltransferase